jgi:hypothetical protein
MRSIFGAVCVFVCAICLLLCRPSDLLAQERGGIAGNVKDIDGAAVANAPVRVKNAATGAVTKTNTSKTGAFEFPQLTAGTYQVSIPNIGFMFERYEQKDITVKPGQSTGVNIVLKFAGNLGTPGDDDSTIVRSRSTPITGPTPRTPDGKPDFSGVWNGSNDPDPEEPSALPWAEAIAKQHIANNFADDPGVRCLPGPYLSGPLFFKFVQTPKLIVVLVENPPYLQQIFLDGRPHPKDFNPSWMGHSIGEWEGDTLVVDTVGFHDRSWVEAYPHTEMLHLVTRYRRPDLGHLEVEIAITDPGTFTKPWKIHNTWDLAPTEEIGEYICNENNKDVPHLVGK